ncbi:Arc family DNA-binding protein [Georgenia sp. TF02-10]|uniref:FitA-like ribbon-helix-helix domain-containing protein n=1 Tax=Georgenia sp. TF02-10 TaxID=2917725 RepID=UPI001FA76B2D|nr:Arc family DNA-binding protein [Georgenia sp. TF02-10]UNX55792.1 Arc family DNA-binding protein [Georgenia sp. TF02-10]
MEQILIRGLPAGTKEALRARAERHHRSVESEAHEILVDALEHDEPVTIVDLLSGDGGSDVGFEPRRLGLTARTAEL